MEGASPGPPIRISLSFQGYFNSVLLSKKRSVHKRFQPVHPFANDIKTTEDTNKNGCIFLFLCYYELIRVSFTASIKVGFQQLVIQFLGASFSNFLLYE
jgi:hypothetical protein